MQTTKRQTARKQFQCTCGALIRPGDVYLLHTASPDHGDHGNLGWWRERECADCAKRYGRGDQLTVPT